MNEAFEIDQPHFKASPWTKGTHDGYEIEFRTCYELVGGKWEGFVAMQIASKNRRSK